MVILHKNKLRRVKVSAQSEHYLLLSSELIFVVKLIIRAVVVCALKKSVHFVLVEIDKAGVAVAVLVIDIIYAFVAV